MLFPMLDQNGTLMKGDKGYFRVSLRDRFINQFTTVERVKYNISVVHINGHTLNAKIDPNGGMIDADFNATIIGPISILIKIEDEHIPGSPLYLTIIPRLHPPLFSSTIIAIVIASSVILFLICVNINTCIIIVRLMKGKNSDELLADNSIDYEQN
jgi:hypothetical protein